MAYCFQVGDLVTRKSYVHDLLFEVTEVDGKVAILRGEDVRLLADAPFEDLKKVNERELAKHVQKEAVKTERSFELFRQDYRLMRQQLRTDSSDSDTNELIEFQMPVQILHLDGDPFYLKKCLDLYKRLGIEAKGFHLKEKEMPDFVEEYVRKIRPVCVVITGHDAYSKKKGTEYELRAYRHSKYFMEAVRKIRANEPSLDQLVIFAGACQSHFESLIRAGANFASSPSRVNIHALDPVYIVAKIVYTSFMDKVNVYDVIRNSLTGSKGMGGVETRGLQRTGMPYIEDLAKDE